MNGPDRAAPPGSAAEKIVGTVTDAYRHLSLLAELAKMDKITPVDARTHMALLRHTYDDLAALLGEDGISRELDEAHASCRAANAEIRDLKEKLGQGATAEAATARLSRLEKAFRTWYELRGFHYATTTWYPTGLGIEMSDQLNHPDKRRSFGDFVLSGLADPVTPYLFGPDTHWDVQRDSFHDNLLDTQANRDNFVNLFKDTFPECQVHGFRSYRERTAYRLRAEALVPWNDIEAWEKSVLRDADPPEGLYHRRLRQIETDLSAPDGPDGLTPALRRNLERDAEKLRAAIAAYGLLAPDAFGGDGLLARPFTAAGPNGTALTFEAGLTRQQALDRLAGAFGLDVAHDLEGG